MHIGHLKGLEKWMKQQRLSCRNVVFAAAVCICVCAVRHQKCLVVGRNKLLWGLMEVRIWDIRAIDHVSLWHSFIWGNCQHQSDKVNECREEHHVLVRTK